MRHIPNLLTLVRMGITPYIGHLLITGNCSRALLLTVLIGTTDGVDGFLARRFNWKTRLGAYLDPLADKLLLTWLYIAFGLSGLAPSWLAWLVVARDVMILLLVAGGWTIGVRDFPPSIWGKASTAIQIVSAVVFLVSCGLPVLHLGALRSVAIWVTAAATLASGFHYLHRAMRVLRSRQLRRGLTARHS